MKKIVSIIIENDGYLIKDNNEEDTFTRIMPQGIQRIPCIPFYHSAWLTMGNMLKPAVTEFVDVVNSQYGKIKGCSAAVAYPADALPADIRMIEQTMDYAGFKEVKLVSKTSLLKVAGVTNYIAISATERLVVLEWYRDGIPTESRYYNKVSVGRRRLLEDIEKIQKRQAGSSLKIYVFDSCKELAGLYSVGEVVDENKALELLVKTGYSLYKIKKAPQLNSVMASEIKAETNKDNISESGILSVQEDDSIQGIGQAAEKDEDPVTAVEYKNPKSKEEEEVDPLDTPIPEESFDEWAYKQSVEKVTKEEFNKIL